MNSIYLAGQADMLDQMSSVEIYLAELIENRNTPAVKFCGK